MDLDREHLDEEANDDERYQYYFKNSFQPKVPFGNNSITNLLRPDYR